MAPTLYMVHPSPPVRAVLITAKSIGLELNLQEINLNEGEHLKPEFLKLNPQHTVPTLVDDDGSVLWDSHAIMTYIVSKYGQHKESLYPKELFKRAVVDQRLHFESGVANPRMLQVAGPIIRKGKTTIEPEDVKLADEVYEFLERFLDGKKWMAGGHLTVADYSLISTISTFNVIIKVDEVKYPNLVTWMRKVEALGEYGANKKGLDMFRELIQMFFFISDIIMASVLYMVPYSQPCRATLMTINALNIKIDIKEVNLMNKEQLATDFIKLNPQHTVPTLVEADGFVLWESHAIMPYLVDKYGKEDDSLYPKDIKKRAIIQQRLHFNNSVLFPLNVLGPIIYEGKKTIPSEKITRVKEVYALLEKFLNGQQWVAGDYVTIADFAIIATITSLNLVIPVTSTEFPCIFAWIQRAEEQPFFSGNKAGLYHMKMIIDEKRNGKM